EPVGGAHGTTGKGHAAGCLVGDFYALAFTGKEHGVIAHYVASAHSGKADGVAVACAGVTFTAIDGAVVQIASQCLRHHFTHAQGGAGRRIHLVAVMGFHDFHVHVVAQHGGSHFQQLE